MSNLRVFKVSRNHPLIFAGGDVRKLIAGEYYVDTVIGRDFVAKSVEAVGGHLETTGDLFWHLHIKPYILEEGATVLMTAGGLGDLICCEPAFRYANIERVVTNHVHYSIIDKQDYFPIPLSSLEGKQVVELTLTNTDLHDCLQPLADIWAWKLIPGGIPDTTKPQIIVDPNLRDWWQQILDDRFVGHPRIMVNLKAHWESRSYPIAWMLEAMRKVADETGAGIVLTGIAGTISTQLNPLLGGGVFYSAVSATGTASDYVALMDCADLIVTPATAAIHIARALGKPLVLINSVYPDVYETCGYDKATVLHPKAPCSPCREQDIMHECKKYDNRGVLMCWNYLKPDAIAKTVIELVEKIGGGNNG